MGSVGVAIFLILAVFAVGYVIAFVLPPRELVVRVNDVKYTRGDLVELVRIKQRGAEFAGESIDSSTNIFESLQTVVENEIIKQSAPSMGITVSDDEIDNRVDAMMRPSEQESFGKSDDQVSRETKERYSTYLNIVQIDETNDPLCTETSNVVTIDGPAIPVELTITPINDVEFCEPAANGAVQASVTGARGTVTYQLARSSAPGTIIDSNTTGRFENLTADTYEITVIDDNGTFTCNDTETFTILPPAEAPANFLSGVKLTDKQFLVANIFLQLENL